MNATLEMKAAGDEPRILVIQSNRSYLGVVARRLKEFGYRVATAETAAAGLAEMYRIPVDLVLCDVTLAGTSGIEFARMVRDDPVNRDIPLLLIVGRSDPAAAVKAFAARRGWGHPQAMPLRGARRLHRPPARSRRCREAAVNDNAMLDARVVERAIQIGELRDELALVRATAVR